MTARKLWATAFARVRPDKRRHESKAAAYRYVEGAAADWADGALRSQYLTVYVDERDGRGWQTFEQIDLADLEPGNGLTNQPEGIYTMSDDRKDELAKEWAEKVDPLIDAANEAQKRDQGGKR